MDAVVDILEGFGITAKKWVDDYLFLNVPIMNALRPHPELQRTRVTYTLPLVSAITTHSTLVESQAAIPTLLTSGGTIPEGHTTVTFTFPYSLKDISTITAPLRFPWADQKWQSFGFKIEFLGFTWDMWHRRVSIPDTKRLKYLERIKALLESPDQRVRLKPLEKAHGSLMHVTFVVRGGLSRLPSLQRCMKGFTKPRLQTRQLTPAALKDLKWWQNTLAAPGAFRTLINRGTPVDRGISVDASKDYGIGLRVGDAFKAWKWQEGAIGSGGRDIGGAEAIALEFAIRYLAIIGIRDELTKVLGDNKSTIGAFNRGRGRNVWTNESVRRSWEVQSAVNCETAVIYVKSKDNPADKVSRGDFSGLTRLSCALDIPLELRPFIVEV